jgi:hypothetical protein
MRNELRTLVTKYEGKRPFGRDRYELEVSIETCLKHRVLRCGLDCSRHFPVVGCCEHNPESLRFIGENFLNTW